MPLLQFPLFDFPEVQEKDDGGHRKGSGDQ